MSTVPGAGPFPQDPQPNGGGSLRDERPALRRCVAGDLDEFARSYWGSQALLSHGPDLPAPFDDLFSLDAADELLSRRGLRTPFLRIAKNGAVVGDNQFTGSAGAGAEIADQVRDDKVAALFAGGHTVVLQALHRTWPALVDFSTQLAADAGHPVQINAYITPAESQGFSAHYDVHDVFVLQVAGEKHWTVHEPVYADPLRNQPWTDHSRAVEAAARDKAPVIDEVLRPGDALYVPRGFLHSAKALGGVSAHLTVGLHTLTRYLLVQELAALAANQPSLRTALPLGFDVGAPEQLAQVLPEVIDLLTQELHAATADALADRLRRRTWSSNRPAPLPPLAHAASIASLAVGTTVRLRPGLPCRLLPSDPLAPRGPLPLGELAPGDPLPSGRPLALGDPLVPGDPPAPGEPLASGGRLVPGGPLASGGPVVLQLPDRTITFPPSTAAAVAELTSGADCKVGDLPGLDDADQLVLVRRLLTEAVVVVADAR